MIETMSATTSRPAPVHLIVGPEEFLAERHRRAIVQSTKEYLQTPELPVEKFKANELDPGELIELLSPSLFADSRIIVITGVEDCGKDTLDMVTEAIDNPVEGMVLIIVHKGNGRNKRKAGEWRKKNVVAHEAEELNSRGRSEFVHSEFKRLGARVTPDVVQFIQEVVGSDTRELASAISQLVADTDGQVDVEAVKRYYTGKAEVSGFEIADFAVTGNVAAAMGLTRRAIQLGESPVKISSALNRAVTGIAKVAGVGRINPRQEAAAYGMAPWQLERTVKFARNWSPAMVARGVQIVAHLDAGVKGQSSSEGYALEKAVLDIAQMVASRGAR